MSNDNHLQPKPVTKQKRVITVHNVKKFINALNKKPFKKYLLFTEEIKSIDGINISDSQLNLIKKSELEGINDALYNISIKMKALDPKLYKKLTGYIFDSLEKSDSYRSVKIHKSLVENILSIYAAEHHVIEDAINAALIQFVNNHKSK